MSGTRFRHPPPIEVPIVDLHADTAMHALDLAPDDRTWGHSLLEWLKPRSTRTVTLETFGRQARGGVQVFTAYEEGLPPLPRLSHRFYTQVVSRGLTGANRTPLNQLVAQLIWIFGQVEKYSDRLVLTGPGHQETRAAFLDETGTARSDARHAIHIGLEGARVLAVQDSDAQQLDAFLEAHGSAVPARMPLPTREQLATRHGRLEYLAEVGVIYIGIVHLQGGFAGTDMPAMKRLHLLQHRTNGLTAAGRELVREMDACGILIDLAHESTETQLELDEMYQAGELTLPLIVSHGVVDTDGRPRWRDTPPETLRLIRESGGIFGTMFAPDFWDTPLAGVSGIVDQIERVIELAGVDHVTFGSDADGFVSLVIDDLGSVGEIIAELQQRGYPREQIEKICYANYLRTLEARDALLTAR